MAGSKMAQVNDALSSIFDRLRPRDKFNVVYYSSTIQYWKTDSLETANEASVKSAKAFIRTANVSGSEKVFLALIVYFLVFTLQNTWLASLNKDLFHSFFLGFMHDGKCSKWNIFVFSLFTIFMAVLWICENRHVCKSRPKHKTRQIF